jgi:hypothetical protein
MQLRRSWRWTYEVRNTVEQTNLWINSIIEEFCVSSLTTNKLQDDTRSIQHQVLWISTDRKELIQFYFPSSLRLSILLHLSGQAIKTVTLCTEECVSIRYYVYCDSSEGNLVWNYEMLVSDLIVPHRRLSCKMRQNLTRSNTFSQTRCERPLQCNANWENVLRICKRVKMPMTEIHPFELDEVALSCVTSRGCITDYTAPRVFCC